MEAVDVVAGSRRHIGAIKVLRRGNIVKERRPPPLERHSRRAVVVEVCARRGFSGSTHRAILPRVPRVIRMLEADGMPDLVDQDSAAHLSLTKLRCLATGICNSEPT